MLCATTSCRTQVLPPPESLAENEQQTEQQTEDLSTDSALGSRDESSSSSKGSLSKTKGGEVEPVSGHQKMISQLKKIHRKNKNNPYFGGAIEQAQRRFLDAKRKRNPFAAMAVLRHLGNELTRKGEPDSGMETFDEMQTILDFVNKSHPEKVDPGLQVSLDLGRAIASIRKGETENCVHCIGGEGCLFPIGPAGVHKHPAGSKAALKHLDAVLKRDPENLTAIWLLNIAHMTLGTFPDKVPEEYRLPQSRLTSQVEFPRFPNISSKLGIDTFSHAGGVVIEDFDGDLDLDIFVSTWTTDGQCRYFRNDGNQGFVDQTEASGLEGIVGGLNTRSFDYDNDGDADVLILRGAWLRKFGRHPNSLLRNDGGNRFVDVAYDVGIAGDDHPTQAAEVADFDLDGDLDLFVGNESDPDQLFRNDDGKFIDVAAAAGIDHDGFAKGATWGDVDNDGDPDLYVSRMGEPNQLYQNNGDGTFSPWDDAGVMRPNKSFSCWFFDYDNDGNLDLFVAAYDEGIDQVAADYFGRPMKESDHDRLFKGNGKGQFTDVSVEVGLGRISQTMGSNFGDLNNDGWLDFYLATGSPAIEALQPNLMYLNQGGEEFVDVSIAGGFSHLQKGHSIAFADLDHDGDQDVFAELGGAFLGDAFQNALFLNPGFDGGWVKLLLEGSASNRTAVGARVEVVVHNDKTARSIHRVVSNGSSFGSNPLRLHFGLGDSKQIESVNVNWPGETKPETFTGVVAGKSFRLTEGEAIAEEIDVSPIEWDVKLGLGLPQSDESIE